jgi:hypothetical protein
MASVRNTKAKSSVSLAVMTNVHAESEINVTVRKKDILVYLRGSPYSMC